jgi:hypothetical protein
VESCNDVDDNCSGQVDKGNPGGGAACVTGLQGVCAAGTKACIGGALACLPNAQPSAETCNGVDDNCDGAIDEDGAAGYTTLYLDTDGDTYGKIGSGRQLCPSQVPAGYTASRGQDCDDLNGNVNPSRTESCATVGVDDNCNGQTDEAGASGCTNYFRDQDGDTFGSNETQCLCAVTGEFNVTRSGDCCDTDDRSKPGQLTYYAAADNCGSYDYNCSTAADKEPFNTGGGCSGWSVGSGCNTNQGWEAASAPACGQSANYVSGGCGYCCLAWTCCCDPTRESRIQKCR